MNKTELVKAVAAKTGFPRNFTAVTIDAMLDTITAALQAGEKVQLLGFGTFEIRERAARSYHNPATQSTVQAEAKKVPVFHAGASLRASVK